MRGGLYNPRPVDDTPVNGQLTHGVTSNWAFDLAAAALTLTNKTLASPTTINAALTWAVAQDFGAHTVSGETFEATYGLMTDLNSWMLRTQGTNGAYGQFGTYDTDTGLVEVARLQGAADPYFQATLPMRILPVATTALPATPLEGMLAYDVTAHKLKVYVAAAWETVTSA